MKSGLKILIATIIMNMTFSACVVEDRYLDEKAVPMLQVDATLFEGEPIRDIKIRRVFDIHGPDPFEIDRNDLWAENAVVRLFEVDRDSGADSLIIPLRERGFEPGRFDTVDPDYRVKPDKRYVLKAEWNGLTASATATIPDYRIEDLNIQASQPIQLPDTLYFTRDQIGFGPPPVDTLIVFKTDLEIDQNIPYNHVTYQVATESEIRALQLYPRFRFDVRDPLKYLAQNIEENQNRFNHQQSVHEYFDVNSDSQQRTEMVIRMVMIVPESIYGDYIEADPSYLVPVFVSNVENGAGLFIGAVRDTLEVRVTIE